MNEPEGVRIKGRQLTVGPRILAGLKKPRVIQLRDYPPELLVLCRVDINGAFWLRRFKQLVKRLLGLPSVETFAVRRGVGRYRLNRPLPTRHLLSLNTKDQDCCCNLIDSRFAGDTSARWAGEFGDAWTERVAKLDLAERSRLFRQLLVGLTFGSAAEIGCNRGYNLAIIHSFMPEAGLVGIDFNAAALKAARADAVPAALAQGSALLIPLGDGSVDLVLYSGLLASLAPHDVPDALTEMGRVARNFAVIGDYHSDTVKPVRYRGRDDLIYAGPYGQAFLDCCPDFVLLRTQVMPLQEEQDFHFWVFERRSLPSKS